MKKSLHVAVGVIKRDGKFLLARRPKGRHMEGYWEFPGGKVEAAEKPEAALARELKEELDIQVESSKPLVKYKYEYEDRVVTLDTWLVEVFNGKPQAMEGQELSWVDAESLPDMDFLPANTRILHACLLPEFYGISSPDFDNIEQFIANSEAAIASHQLKLFQLRAPSVPFRMLVDIAKVLKGVCERHCCRLLVNAEPKLLDYVDVDGLHLNQENMRELIGESSNAFKNFGDKLVGVSCHNADEIKQAHVFGASFVTLSPVNATASHPEQQGMGWSVFTQLCENADLPVYALGGMNKPDLPAAREAGAIGVAAISALSARD